jgi:hypothetical protein
MTQSREEVRQDTVPHRRCRESSASVHGEYLLRPSGAGTDSWQVGVGACAHLVTRDVARNGQPWSRYDDDMPGPGEVIWPTWPATLTEEASAEASPLAELQRHWDIATSRVRDSAKWIATVLGAALASIIPAAPLTGLTQRHISAAAAAAGISGLVLVSVTMLLILRVLQPQMATYEGIECAGQKPGLRGRIGRLGSPLYRWQHVINTHPDLYLPCGVISIAKLRDLLLVEEATLVALARAEETADHDDACKTLRKARAAAAARLHVLRTAAAGIVTVGAYYKVRARSAWANYAGVTSGVAGIMLIITAVTLSSR